MRSAVTNIRYIMSVRKNWRFKVHRRRNVRKLNWLLEHELRDVDDWHVLHDSADRIESQVREFA